MAPPNPKQFRTIPRGIVMANARSVPKDAAPLVSLKDTIAVAGGKATAMKAQPLGVETKPPVVGAINRTVTTEAGVTKLILSVPPDASVRIRLLLTTAGPCVWGFLQSLTPLASGQGRFLIQNVEQVAELPPATRLYLAADSVQSVGFTVEPIPYGSEILSAVRAILAIQKQLAGR